MKAVGVAQAMLLDVRNGYPYGTIQSSTDDKSQSTRVKSHDTGDRLREEVMASAVVKLTGEAEEMMRKLKRSSRRSIRSLGPVSRSYRALSHHRDEVGAILGGAMEVGIELRRIDRDVRDGPGRGSP